MGSAGVLVVGVVRLLLVLAAAQAAAVAGEGDEAADLLFLSDANFEHDTQAATGQTTGAWLVLFNEADNLEGGNAEAALRTLLLDFRKHDAWHPLFAKVDVAHSPKTAKRFSVVNLPILKLFRNRKMFTYSGPWSTESIFEFVKEGWETTRAEEVPREAGVTDELLGAFQRAYSECFQFLGNHPMALALVASLVALAAYTTTSRMLMKKTKRGRKGRPRAATKKRI